MAKEDIIIEILKRIQGDLVDLRRRMDTLEVRQAAVEDHLRGLLTSVTGLHSDMQVLNSRVDRIERRLDLVTV